MDLLHVSSPPRSVLTLLRLEGAAVLASMLVAYQALGGNWWLFALLFFTPDLSMLGYLVGSRAGAIVYNTFHTYMAPALLAGAGLVTGAAWLLPIAAIWAAHIGGDRALGYGLKYPDGFGLTHLGLIGPARKEAARADAR